MLFREGQALLGGKKAICDYFLLFANSICTQLFGAMHINGYPYSVTVISFAALTPIKAMFAQRENAFNVY